MSTYRTHRSSYYEALALAKDGTLKTRWRVGTAPCPERLPADIDLADKVDGMILGLAIGDALGNTSESRNPADRRAQFGWIEGYQPNRHAGGLRVGLPSDDTQLAAWTIEQFLDDGHIEPQLLGNRFCAERIFGLGGTVRDFITKFKGGTTWVRSGSTSAGNGALMRIAPVVLPYLREPSSDMWADTLMAAHLTPNDDLSNSSCVAFVNLLWKLLGAKESPQRDWWVREWSEMAQEVAIGDPYKPRNGHPPESHGTMPALLDTYVTPSLARDLPVEEACAIWHSGAYLLETVPSALYILARHGHDPRRAILEAVNNARDNDTVGAIVGAAVGALHGAGAFPQEWIDGLLGQTRSDDDHHLFKLLERTARHLHYKPRPQTLTRASAARERTLDSLASQLEPGQVLDLGTSGYWIKVVAFLVHNWAVIHHDPVTDRHRVWFFDDGAAVFDVMEFRTRRDAESALSDNGFEPFGEKHAKYTVSPLVPDYIESSIESEGIESQIAAERERRFQWWPGRIYSSGQYWVKRRRDL